MKFHETYCRKRSLKQRSSLPVAFLILPLLFCLGLPQPAFAQETETTDLLAVSPLTAEQVVERLVSMNLQRAQALHGYVGTRIYQVEYRGFPGTRSASMVVEVNFKSPGTKEFTIRSATGSKLILDKVFKKLLEAEKDALAVDAQRQSALNGDNYVFTLIAYKVTPSGSMYVLTVEPRTKAKFLYRGRIWVDAEDFALVRLEAAPAKNPSFWTKNSAIEQVYKKVNDFWLPARNHSISSIRLGGHAELTIEYGAYEITSSDPVGKSSKLGQLQPAYSRTQSPGDPPE